MQIEDLKSRSKPSPDCLVNLPIERPKRLSRWMHLDRTSPWRGGAFRGLALAIFLALLFWGVVGAFLWLGKR